jgi:hypothetical protein
VQLWGDGFREVGEADHRGFRVIHLHAAEPTIVPPQPAHDGPVSSPDALVLAPG